MCAYRLLTKIFGKGLVIFHTGVVAVLSEFVVTIKGIYLHLAVSDPVQLSAHVSSGVHAAAALSGPCLLLQ